MTYNIHIPYNLTDAELQVSGRDIHGDDLSDLLHQLAEDYSPGEINRICLAACLIHDRTRHPFSECLEQAMVWERG